MKNAYRACQVSKSTKGNHGGRALNVYRLVTDHGIKLPQTMQFTDVDIDQDGILTLDLRTAKISGRSAAHYRRHRERTEDGKYPADNKAP